MSSSTMNSNLEKPNISIDPNLFTILEDIRGQLINLGQRMDRMENDRRDNDRKEDRQPNLNWEDKVPRTHDCYVEDDRYQRKSN